MKRTSLIAGTGMALMTALVITATPVSAASKDQTNMANRGEFAVGQTTAPVDNVTPVENGFACFAANYLSRTPVRPVFSVGRITDQTGKFSNEASAGGFQVTQGMTNMVYTALGKLSPSVYGLPDSPDFNIVERSDTGITESELNLAKQSLLADTSEANGLRHVRGGQIVGTDYYITGAITEINYNIDSGGAELFVNQIGAGKRVYTMSVAMDLRVVDSKSSRVIKTVSERKVIRGYEVKASVFNFLGIYLFDLNAGRKAEEPIELGVRATMESALLKLVGAVYKTPYGAQCADWANTNLGKVTSATLELAKASPPGAVSK